VILTHLHLDHVGGAFVADPDGKPLPRFTNARHIIRQEEWDDAMNPDDRSRVSYPADRLRCLEDSGLIDFVDADTEVLPGIRVIRTGGHTRGHQIVTMSSGDRTVVFCGDLFPIVGVLRPTYISAADLFPLETLEHKKKLLSEVIEKNWIVAFDHDLEYKFATLKRDDRDVVPEKVGEPFLAALRSCADNLNESRKAMG
jgi:glyoxylase-like metal-dependent hydrolase (beta-lactamase superfamily II)